MQQFISNLSFTRKFALIAAVALLLLAVPATLLLAVQVKALKSAERELAGIPPVGALLKLVQLTQQHRGLSAGFLSGQAAAAEARKAKQTEVDAAWVRVHQDLLKSADADLQQRARTMAESWNALGQVVSSKALVAPESFSRHTALVAAQLALLQSVATESGLSRLNKLSGYYVQLAVLAHLPRLSESMGQLRARANGVLVRGEIGTEDRLRLDSLVAQSRQASEALQLVLAELRRVSPEQSKNIEATASLAVRSAEEVLSLAEAEIIKADAIGIQPKAYWDRITQAIDQQFVLNGELFAELAAEISASRDGVLRQMVALGVTVLLLLTAGGWLMLSVARGVKRSVNQALLMAQSVAEGDLTTPVTSQSADELGQLLDALLGMQRGLSTVVGSVRLNAEVVATASQQIAQGNSDLSGRTEEQASALQQTAATMDELASTVRNNAENSRQADELARGAASIAIRGGEMVGQVEKTMRSIQESSRQIAEIIAVIDGIAFQTNILALNAAVEAARAGEQGRGFAVVASEVRMLAQRSSDAARQIKDLITTSVHRVEQGTVLVDEAGQTMKGIVVAIDRVKGVVSEISNSSAEQSQGVTQVGQAVSQMDQATQQNAALVEQSAAAAESLKEQAQALVSAVAAFRLAA